ncbi:MAG: Ni/Fe-hydrogenase cytochrome b subunit [Phycisphaerae bacterium]|nr:Ni/Fe-hydrogenase cytochrome b subunit [Phycisphaerae bacterium]
MELSRRELLEKAGAACLGGSIVGLCSGAAPAPESHVASGDWVGVLVDLVNCNGCRRCEAACQEVNGFEVPTPDELQDKSVFAEIRRPGPRSYTTVNEFPLRGREGTASSIYVKANCLHCNDPACVSACLVGAIRKQPNGAVTYDPWKCMGCRYCMVACPFGIPTYEYDNVWAPQVRKCTLCSNEGNPNRGGVPACVQACPKECLTYGKRDELLARAHQRIKEHPDVYIDHVYGEHEAGGTSWLYLSSVPFEKIGFLNLDSDAPPRLTETIQHGVFKHFMPPVALCGVLGLAMWLTRPEPQPGLHASLPDGEQQSVPSPTPREREGEQVQSTTRVADHDPPVPVNRKLLTPGVWALLALMAFGAVCGVYRLLFGLEASTNLNQQYPWGLWIIADVSFIALAAGGFTTAAIAHIFHRQYCHALARPALVAALLGYTFACVVLAADLGRYYNIWHPMLPSMWQGNSALFEVGMCVMCYLVVLYVEFVPIFCERFIGSPGHPKLSRVCEAANRVVGKTMFLFIILGVAISCLHQSSLGHVMALVPSKLHPLWYSPILSLLFLLSAIATGFPTVIFVCICGSWALKLKPEMRVLGALAKYIPFFLSIYLAVKIGDMLIRGTWLHIDGSPQSMVFIVEMLLGLVIPIAMTASRRVRGSPRWLSVAALLVMLGVVLNRANVYLIGYQPPHVVRIYFPSLAEWGLTIGSVAALLVLWRVIVTYFPVIGPPLCRVETACADR